MAHIWKEPQDLPVQKEWYLLHAAKQCEGKVVHRLQRNLFECWSPFANLRDPKHTASKPLSAGVFKSFVFVKSAAHDIIKLQHVKGVQSIMYWLQKPVTISSCEIENMRKFFDDHTLVQCKQIPIQGMSAATTGGVNESKALFGGLVDDQVEMVVLQSIGFVLYAKANLAPYEAKAKPITIELDLRLPAILTS